MQTILTLFQQQESFWLRFGIIKKIVAIDQLGDEFLEAVQDGQQIEIKEDGTVSIC